MDSHAFCPWCGNGPLPLNLWVDFAPSTNGASTPRRTRTRSNNAPTKARRPSAYHAFVSEGRRAGSSMAEIQDAWRDQKAIEAKSE